MIDFDKLGVKRDNRLENIYSEGEKLHKFYGGYIFDTERIVRLSQKYNIFRKNLDTVIKTASAIDKDTSLSYYAYVLLAAIKENEKIPLELMPDFGTPETDMLLIYPIFYFAEQMIENMQKRNLPPEIISDTLADFDATLSAHSNIFGVCGARIYYDWLVPYVYGRILRIGRFNIEIAKFRGNPNTNILNIGDDVLSVHIPANLPLNQDITEKSLSLAEQIFKTYYKEYNFKAFVCRSWLLNPELQNIMGGETNITRFASNFVRFPLNDSGDDIYRFLYNLIKKTDDINSLPENSSMQKKVKEYLLKGNIFHCYDGVRIFKN